MFGGERFDRLIEIYGNYDLPATGFAMGDVTLRNFLESWNLLPNIQNETKYLVTLWPSNDERYLTETSKITQKLREKGINCEMWLDQNTKLEKQIKYADKKGIDNVVIMGETELKEQSVSIKNLKSGEQQTTTFEKFVGEIS